MKITVITVTYNAQDCLEETILSVFGQTHKDLEYIVIDGASTDATGAVVRRYMERIAKYISEPDHGIYDAMNKGIACASGDFIAFMNAGDRFADKHALADISESLNGNRDCMIACGRTVLKYDDRHSRMISPVLTQYGMPTYHQAMFFSREVFAVFGKYDISYSLAADYDIWLKVYSQCKDHIICIDRVISVNDMNGISNENYFKALSERRRIGLRHLNGIPMILFMLRNALDVLRCAFIALLRISGGYGVILLLRCSKK